MNPLAARVLGGLQPCRSQLVASQLVARLRWACASLLPRSLAQCRSASSSSDATKKPVYITTPIFYANAAPHIGHLYTMVLADVLKRWHQLNGREAVLCTGTDEHGMKMQRAVANEGVDPKQLCDSNSRKFSELAAAANVSHDWFVRTTDADHKQAVQQAWLKLKDGLPEKLSLYRGTYEGWYCVSDECFYPQDMVEPLVVPQTGKKMMVSVESGNEVEWTKEDTWFFPLTKYRDALLRFYDANPFWIKPQVRMGEVRDWVENRLEDLSMTRPAARLGWGIPTPDDAQQTIYVWVDALLSYISKAGYGSRWQAGGDETAPWPADVHVIGKDILRFHAVYWPALLMALELPLPKAIVCHNHWTMSDKKISKSLGNIVNPFFALQRWDVDPLRYFLVHGTNFAKDMSYSNSLIGATYAKELQANLGNLLYRISRPKAQSRWSTEEAVAAYRDDELELPASIAEADSLRRSAIVLESMVKETPRSFRAEIDSFNVCGAIRVIFHLLRETNRYVTDMQPWVLAKETDDESRQRLNTIVFNSAEALRIASILLQPVMPTKAAELLDELGVKAERRTIEYAHKGKDAEYGVKSQPDADGKRLRKWDSIFPPPPNAEDSDDMLRAQLRSMLQSKTKNPMNQMVELLAMEARMGEAAAAELLAEVHTRETEGEGGRRDSSDV